MITEMASFLRVTLGDIVSLDMELKNLGNIIYIGNILSQYTPLSDLLHVYTIKSWEYIPAVVCVIFMQCDECFVGLP